MGWQTRERGLQLSRTPHARSSCIIVKFPTIAWRTQILASDSQVRSYDGRTVCVEWSLRRANCKRFPTYGRLTEAGQGQRAEWGRGSQWRCMDRLGCPTLRRFQSLLVLSFYGFGFKNKTTQLSTVTALKHSPPSRRLGPTASSPANSREGQTYGLFADKAEEYAGDVSLQGRIPRRYALRFFLPSTAPCKITARSSSTHGLESRLA